MALPLDWSLAVPPVMAFVVDILADRANHSGLAFIAGSLAVSWHYLLPRRRERERRRQLYESTHEPLSPHQIITSDDLHYIEKARSVFLETPKPIHSNFLVAACISYIDEDGEQRQVVGVNSETCVLPSAICAERCALLQV